MTKWLPAVLLVLSAFSCGDKKKAAIGDQIVEQSDFVSVFTKLKLPYSITDTAINAPADTTTIPYTTLFQFVPDTVLNKVFGAEKNLTVYPIGKHEVKGKERYLLMQVKSKKKEAVYLLVFDKNNKFSASMPLVETNTDRSATYTAVIDPRLAISINKEWKKENDLLYNRVIYAYNNVGTFTVVMTETNDQSGLSNKLNNPLDTVSKNNKYSGDYVKGKKSIMIIRDGKTPNSYLFFIHFENEPSGDEEPCIGELKGDLVLNSPNTAVFTEDNDPCVIDFSFTSNQVTIKEKAGCGSHRGIKCFFNDSYTKKREPKSQKKK